MNLGPDEKVTGYIDFFLRELDDDFQAPGQSHFQDCMAKLRRDVLNMEESLSGDKSFVRKLITSLKEAVRAGEAHGSALATFADDLVKYGVFTSSSEPVLGNSFVKFGTLMNQMASLLTNLVSSTRNIVFFSLNLLFENELKGAKYKSNIKTLYSQYDSARVHVEREEKRALLAAGGNTEKVFTAEELAVKLVDERRKFQLGVCEYMLKVIDVKTKRGADLAEHLVGYYQAQENYFKEGGQLLSALKSWEDRFTNQVAEVRTKQDEDRKRLAGVKAKLRQSLGIGAMQAGIVQVDPSANTGLTQKSGYLDKRPDNVLRLNRKQWRKCYCTVNMNGFTIAHTHTHAPHVRIPVLHFQFKECGELEGHKCCFKLQGPNRAYTFDAESEGELMQWREVMTNCQLQAFGAGNADAEENQPGTSATAKGTVSSPLATKDTKALVKRIIAKIRALPGNDKCCDCGSPDPEWLSVNLGVLMCIHCSGRHRELGVQYSRIRSLKLDAIKTCELLIARVMGNALLNEVLEANLPFGGKLSSDASMEQRREFVTNKYIHHCYIEHVSEREDMQLELLEAVELRDIRQLLQVYAEGVDMKAVLPNLSCNRTAIHLAIEQEDLTSLHILDFILGNSIRSENVVDSDGNTPLHCAVLTDNPQCIKLLLNHGSNVSTKNNDSKTALDIAEEKKFDDCVELLQDSVRGKLSKCEHIDIDWGVTVMEQEEDIYQTPGDVQNGGSGIRRSETTDSLVSTSSSSSGLGGPGRSPKPNLKTISSPSLDAKRRPASQFVETSTQLLSRPAYKPYQPNVYPPPSDPAPPPPMRTVSKNAQELSHVGPSRMPVAPKRKKRTTSLFPDQFERPPAALPTLGTVEAIYDCDPDRSDELMFKEGERIVVVAKLNNDWWRGFIDGEKSREGLFPVNYVREVNS